MKKMSALIVPAIAACSFTQLSSGDLAITSVERAIFSEATWGDQEGNPFETETETLFSNSGGVWDQQTQSSLYGSSGHGVQNTDVGVGGMSGSGYASAWAPGSSQGNSLYGAGSSTAVMNFTVLSPMDYDFASTFHTYSSSSIYTGVFVRLYSAGGVLVFGTELIDNGEWWEDHTETFGTSGQLLAGEYTLYTSAEASAFMGGGTGGQQSAEGLASYDFTFNLVPGPGVMAVFGIAGLGRIRRRR